MQNSKVIQLISSLQPKEIKGLEQYLAKHITPKEALVNALFVVIKSWIVTNDNTLIIKEVVLNKLHLSDDEGDKKFRYACTYLAQYVEQYLIQIHLQNNPITSNELLLKELQVRNAKKQFDTIIIDEFEKNKLNEPNFLNYYEKEFQLSELRYKALQPNELRGEKNNLQHLVEYLDLFYITRKLYYTCELLNNNNSYTFQYKANWLAELQVMIAQTKDKTPILDTYNTVLLTLLYPEDESHFLALQSKIEKLYPTLHPARFKELNTYLRNYIVRKINTGFNQYNNLLFENNIMMLQRKLFLLDQYFDEFAFKNIVVIALRVGQVQWAETFILQHQNQLNPLNKDNALTYNTAYLLFHKKEYHKGLQLLNQVSFTDAYYHLDSKSLLLKLYYELDETAPFFSLIEAFKVYLKRNKKINENQLLFYSNFIVFCTKLYKIKLQYPHKTEKLENELKTAIGVADKQWIITKLIEIKSK